ncbi:MAG: hypothetical protein D6705_16485 [Deltaproteobacteria bacterium]|nr:MAG: hypothetical protein D6705_16485 [Deltaproteobacteria bacterium]
MQSESGASDADGWSPSRSTFADAPEEVGALFTELAAARAVGVCASTTRTGAEEIALVGLYDGRPPVGGVVPWDGAVHAWKRVWRDAAPYLVTFAGKPLVSRLLAEGLEPRRLGDVRIALVLLAEGAARVPDDPATALAAWIDSAEPPALHPADDAAVRREAATVAYGAVVALRALAPRLRSLGLARLFDLECRLVPVVARMEAAGMPVDAAAFQRIADDWAAERARTTDPARTARLDKLLSTYAHWPRTYVDLDGRIRCRFDPLAADSGRFSCSEPNLQQVPTERTAPGLRACFRAPPGHCFVVADYAQIELRVAAALAPCERLADVFRHRGDPHRATAATLTGKRPEAVTPAERKLAKAINFGFLFGMGARTFRSYAKSSYGLDLDEAAARRAKDAFFRTYPGLAAWHRRTAAQGRGAREVVVRTVLGRRKRFPPGGFSLPAALNVPVQGTAAEGFKRALVDLDAELPALGGRVVLCVHDEVVVEVPASEADAARERVVEIMRAAMEPLLGGVPVEVEAVVAPCWR